MLQERACVWDEPAPQIQHIKGFRPHHLGILARMRQIREADVDTDFDAAQAVISEMRSDWDDRPTYLQTVLGTTPQQELAFALTLTDEYRYVFQSPKNRAIRLTVAQRDGICNTCQWGKDHCGNFEDTEFASDAIFYDGQFIAHFLRFARSHEMPALQLIEPNDYIDRSRRRNTRVIITTVGTIQTYIQEHDDKLVEL